MRRLSQISQKCFFIFDKFVETNPLSCHRLANNRSLYMYLLMPVLIARGSLRKVTKIFPNWRIKKACEGAEGWGGRPAGSSQPAWEYEGPGIYAPVQAT
jgi:hypothetical protein